MSLDMGLLMAGAKERGELEARVTTLISEIQKSGDCIFSNKFEPSLIIQNELFFLFTLDILVLQVMSFFSLMKFTHLLVRAQWDEETRVLVLTFPIY